MDTAKEFEKRFETEITDLLVLIKEQYQICHIQARKCIPVPLEPYMRKTLNNCYMVVKVLEKNASEPRLDALREHVMQPVSIVDDDHSLSIRSSDTLL